MQEQVDSGDPAYSPRHAHRKVVSFPGPGRGSSVLMFLLYFVGADWKVRLARFGRSELHGTAASALGLHRCSTCSRRVLTVPGCRAWSTLSIDAIQDRK